MPQPNPNYDPQLRPDLVESADRQAARRKGHGAPIREPREMNWRAVRQARDAVTANGMTGSRLEDVQHPSTNVPCPGKSVPASTPAATRG